MQEDIRLSAPFFAITTMGAVRQRLDEGDAEKYSRCGKRYDFSRQSARNSV